MKDTRFGPAPWLQTNWDARAALNFIAGGAGSALVAWAAFVATPPATQRFAMALGASLVALGLISVWAEIGRPARALNVLRQPRRSWMAREAWVAPLVIGGALAVAVLGWRWAALPAAIAALAFLYCQARILQAARGIPAWREPLTASLIVSTGLAEGFALCVLLLSPHPAYAWMLGALLVLRFAIGAAWYRRLAPRLGERARQAVNAAGHAYNGGTLAALALLLVAVASPLPALWGRVLLVLAAVLAVGGGALFKWQLVTRAAFNQGFALPRLPVRGAPRTAAVTTGTPR
jgi:phenylacetyl-CoA:acceptor oxidoreductase subunit 2